LNAGTIEVRLRQIRLEAERVASYEFVSVTGAPLPPFTAGAHIDLHLPNAMIRSYSLVNASSERDRYVVAVQHEADGQGGSAWMHTTPRVGDLFRIVPPANDFPLDEHAPTSVFIAGGIGVTPIVSMVRRLVALGRPWHLHYAARSEAEAPYAGELRALADAGQGELVFSFRDTRTRRLDIPGIVREAPSDAHLYCCGPGAMIDVFQNAAGERPPATVHCERFSASAAADTSGGFEVVLAKSGRRITIEAGKTILDTLLDHSVDVAYACSAGVCGTCITRVIEGVPEHRDDYLTDEEKHANASIMVCCSGSRSPTLVLDL
jgi:vanillate O-demethylase ferredoxin subunit